MANNALLITPLFAAITLNGCTGMGHWQDRPSSLQHPSAVPRSAPLPAGSVRNALVTTAQQQLGRPYVWGGEDASGFDCSGLMQYVHQQAGLRIPRTAKAQHDAANTVSLNNIQPGDLLFFQDGKRTGHHVGIYLGENRMIHASTSKQQVVVTTFTSTYWTQRFLKAGRFRDQVI